MSRWQQVPDRPRHRSAGGRVEPVVVPLAIAAVLAWAGHPIAAAIVVATATVLLVASTLRPEIGHRVARAAAAFGRGVAGALSWVLLGVVHLLVIVPGAALARLVRRDPLGPDTPTTRWRPRGGPRTAARTFGPEVGLRHPLGRLGRFARAVPLAMGTVVLLAGLNYGLGWLWDEHVGSHDVPVGDPPRLPVSARAATPAFSDEAWAGAYWQAFDALPIEPVPFLLTRVGDADGDLISSRDGVRSTDVTTIAGDPVRVWLLGGAGAWGEGQRDDHTVASELVRLAAADDVALEVVNLGQLGHTTWQTALLFEQELAVRPAPDLAVFYGGVEDALAQVESANPAPTHLNAEGIGTALTGRESAQEQVEDLWNEYRDTSVVTRLAEAIGGVVGLAPTAARADGEEDLVERLVDLRVRSTDLVAGVARRAGVRTATVWQPATEVPGDGGAYRSLTVPEGDIDLRSVVDDRADTSVLEGTILDEDGAALVAEVLWADLAGRLGA